MKINNKILELETSIPDNNLRADYQHTLERMFNNPYWESSNFQYIDILNYLLNRYHNQTFPKYENMLIADSFLLKTSSNISYSIMIIDNKLELLPVVTYDDKQQSAIYHPDNIQTLKPELLALKGLKTKRFILQTNKKAELVIFAIPNELENKLFSMDDDELEKAMIKFPIKLKNKTKRIKL